MTSQATTYTCTRCGLVSTVQFRPLSCRPTTAWCPTCQKTTLQNRTRTDVGEVWGYKEDNR